MVLRFCIEFIEGFLKIGVLLVSAFVFIGRTFDMGGFAVFAASLQWGRGSSAAEIPRGVD